MQKCIYSLKQGMLTAVRSWAKIVKFHNLSLNSGVIFWSLLSKKGDGSIAIVHFNKFYL
jgi:hypothetical protein